MIFSSGDAVCGLDKCHRRSQVFFPADTHSQVEPRPSHWLEAVVCDTGGFRGRRLHPLISGGVLEICFYLQMSKILEGKRKKKTTPADEGASSLSLKPALDLCRSFIHFLSASGCNCKKKKNNQQKQLDRTRERQWASNSIVSTQ